MYERFSHVFLSDITNIILLNLSSFCMCYAPLGYDQS